MLRKFLKDERGVSEIVATAGMTLVMFLLFTLMLQIVILGTSQIAVNEAAFEAARSAARSSTPYTTAVQTAQNFGKGFIANWTNNVNVTMPQAASQAGQPLTVQVSYNVPTLLTIFKPTPVYGQSTQILEEQP